MEKKALLYLLWETVKMNKGILCLSHQLSLSNLLQNVFMCGSVNITHWAMFCLMTFCWLCSVSFSKRLFTLFKHLLRMQSSHQTGRIFLNILWSILAGKNAACFPFVRNKNVNKKHLQSLFFMSTEKKEFILRFPRKGTFGRKLLLPLVLKEITR